MNREELLIKLENNMLALGKSIHDRQVSKTHYSPALDHLLMVVAMRQEMSVKQLASILHVTSGAVTQHIETLEKEGLLTREVNVRDRREIIIRLTDKGSQAYDQTRKAKFKIMSDVFSVLDDEELHSLVSLVDKASQQYISNRKV